jgi:hypothetical protein
MVAAVIEPLKFKKAASGEGASFHWAWSWRDHPILSQFAARACFIRGLKALLELLASVFEACIIYTRRHQTRQSVFGWCEDALGCLGMLVSHN